MLFRFENEGATMNQSQADRFRVADGNSTIWEQVT